MSFHSFLIIKIHSFLTSYEKCEHKPAIPSDFRGLWLRLSMTLADTLFADPVFHPPCHCGGVLKKIWDVKNICYNKHKKHRPAVNNGKYSKGLDLEKKLINFWRIIALIAHVNDPSHIKLFQYNLVSVSLRTKDASAALTKIFMNCYKFSWRGFCSFLLNSI